MLKKLFIKDYQNTCDPAVRERYGTVSGAFGIVTNIVLFVIKLLIGLFSNSITIIADAVNNLTDVGSSVLTMLGFKLSSKPADKEHPYGHARYEQVTALLIALLVLSIGVLFAKSSIEKIISPEELSFGIVTYLTLIAAIVLKLVQMLVYLDFAKSIDSDTIRAAAMDSRNDVITTLSVLLSVIIMGLFNVNIDGYVGLLVSVFLIISALKMVSQTISPMLGMPPSKELVDSIYSLIHKSECVKGVHDLIVHNYGVGANFASVHAEVDAACDIIAIHDEIDNIERECHKALGVMLTIHMDPIDYSNPLRQKLYDITKSAVLEFNPDLTIHDFRIVDGPTHTNVLFDVVEPLGIKIDLEALKKLMSERYPDDNEYFFYVTVDKDLN